MFDLSNLTEEWRRTVRFAAQFSVLALAIILMQLGGRESKPKPPSRNPMELIASTNDPYMIESIRIAQMPSSEDGAWTSGKRRSGPTATFAKPGGTIKLTAEEIANANTIYPQLKRNPKILYGSRSGSASGVAYPDDDAPGEWGNGAR